MIQVRCISCQSGFDLDERRIPKNGMRVRCPKCSTSFHVSPDGQTRADAGPPVPPAPGPAKAQSPPVRATMAYTPGLAGKLPAPAAPPPMPGLPSPDEPLGNALGARPSTPHNEASFAELDDLPSPAVGSGVGLPARKPMTPGVRTTGALPVPAGFDDLDLPPLTGSVTGELTGLPALHSSQQSSSPQASQPAGLPSLARAPMGTSSRAALTSTGSNPAFDLDDPLMPSVAQAPLPSPVHDSLSDFGAVSPPVDFGGMGDLDLEMPPLPPGAALPAVAQSNEALPANVAPAADLPRTVARPLGRVALKKQPVYQSSFVAEEENLPNPVAAALPHAGGVGLPSTAGVGLPSASGVGLPSASGVGLPNPSGASLPRSVPPPAFGDDFGSLEPPMARTSSPSMPSSLSPSQAVGAAMAQPRAPMVPTEPSLFMPATRPDEGFGELDLPMGESPSDPGASLPPSRPAPVRATGTHLPLPPPPEHMLDKVENTKRPKAKGGTGFGELDLDEGEGPVPSSPPRQSVPSGGSADEEFDEIPIERTQDHNAQGAQQSVPSPLPRPSGQQPPKDTSAAPAKPAAKNRGLFIGLGVLGFLVVGGAALGLTPAGPYGRNIIDAQLNGPARAAAARAALQAGHAALDRDVFGRARASLRDLDAAMAAAPGQAELTAFNLFAHAYVLARFGNDTAIAARARNLLERLRALPAGTPWMAEARAAYALATGGTERTRLRGTDPLTRDLGFMVQLDANDTAAALEALRPVATPQSSPRTRYLLVRAQYMAEDFGSASREAEALLQSVPEHAGAMLLLAKMLSARAETRERAVELAQRVEHLATGPTAAASDQRSDAAVLVGQIEMQRDRVTAAREAFDRALQIDPRASAALVGSATILYRQGSFADARARFQAAQSDESSDIDARLGIAMCSISLGDAPEARRLLEPLLTNHASDARVHYWLAKALNAVDDRNAAEREFREAIRLDSTNLDAYTTLATLLTQLQRPDAADQVLQEARSHVADQTAIHRALGESRAARGMYAEAATELRLAIQGRGDDLRSHFLLANVARRARDFATATHELDAVTRLDPEYPGLLLERGLLAEAEGHAGDAVATFRAALQRSPDNRELKVRLGAALVANGQAQEAIAELQQFVADNPNYAEGHYVLGRAFLDSGDSANAVRLLERATELDATRADFHAYAAQANLQRMQLPRARIHADQAIQLDSNYARGYWVRGELLVRQGQVRLALDDANRALVLDPTFADAMTTLADADEALSHRREAIELYRRALGLRPNAGQWHARLGRLLSDEGRAGEAQASYERAIALGDPLNPPPSWLAPAHRELGDALHDRDRAAARRHYERFLELSPANGPGVSAVRMALREL